VFFADEELRCGGGTGGFDGTEDEGGYVAQVAGEKGGSVDGDFDEVSTVS